MVTPTFPTGLFSFSDQEIDIERQTLSGGTSIDGEEDVVAVDGGGRVFADFSGGALVDKAQRMAWRALAAIIEEGATSLIVPFCDARHQPYSSAQHVPHSDDTPFSDGSLYTTGGTADIVDAAILRATSLNLSLAEGISLGGGEWFSIEHPGKGWRAYKVRTIDETGTTVTFRPPLREAVGAGDLVELKQPRCLMRLRPQTRPPTGTSHFGALGEAAIRFVEAP